MKFLVLMLAIFVATESSAQIYGFNTFDSSYGPNGDELQVKNMPPVRSQDTLGVCYAFSASAIIEHTICKENKLDCKDLPNDQRPSVLDLARYATDPSKLQDKSDPNSYPKELGNEFTFGMDIILNMFNTESVSKESCAPFDNIVSKARSVNEQRADEEKMWLQFRNAYDMYKIKSKDCEQCALDYATTTGKDLQKSYNLKTNNLEMLKAFGAATYQEFLFRALVPENCGKAGKRIRFYTTEKKMGIWPLEDTNKPNYDVAITKIKEQLSNDRPVLVNSLCTLKQPNRECIKTTSNGTESGGHGLVITGFRKMCNKSGKCYDAVKVHNSWGQAWQDANNDGWVEAKELLDRTRYQYGTLSWIEFK
ncbi:MAG: hypothetical protein IPM97_13800 [Bdellovibrionaceae bacterium]|nr:hypothetical protein [Pseudobdellovibrionaceae bacterium]